MKKIKNKIIFAAQNPGGFNALWPVIKKISRQAKLQVVLAAEAKEIARNKKIAFVDADTKNDKELKEIIVNFKPRAVLAGTSQGLSIDKKIIVWARQKKIPTISIIDFWSNYKMRFSSPGTDDLIYLPDAICVADEYMKKQMVKEGFEARRLFITGNPFFDTFGNYANKKGRYIIFAEQPFSELFVKSGKMDKASNFNEVKIFSDFVEVLEKQKTKYPVLIALHPRCKNINKFDKIIAASSLKISVFEGDTKNLWKKASLILGINSMVLFQSALEGKKVLSYQPGIKKGQDPLVSNRLGLSQAAYGYLDLERKIKQILDQIKSAGNYEKIRQKYVNNNSTQKVIEVIRKLT